MQRGGARPLAGGRPCLAVEDRSVRDGGVHELGSLGEDPARAERVVADLAVAHVVVGRQSDCLAVGPELGGHRGVEERVEAGGVGLGDGV